jgi:hypothetical protein
MTYLLALDSACPGQLRRDGACLREGVARRHGCRRNWARTTPQTTTTNQPHHNPQRWVEKVGRSIKGSETPHTQHPQTTPTGTLHTTPHHHAHTPPDPSDANVNINRGQT